MIQGIYRNSPEKYQNQNQIDTTISHDSGSQKLVIGMYIYIFQDPSCNMLFIQENF